MKRKKNTSNPHLLAPGSTHIIAVVSPQEGVLLGAVGAYDWNGTVIMQMPGGTVIPKKNQFYDPKTEVGYERLAGYTGKSFLSHLFHIISLTCHRHRYRFSR